MSILTKRGSEMLPVPSNLDHIFSRHTYIHPLVYLSLSVISKSSVFKRNFYFLASIPSWIYIDFSLPMRREYFLFHSSTEASTLQSALNLPAGFRHGKGLLRFQPLIDSHAMYQTCLKHSSELLFSLLSILKKKYRLMKPPSRLCVCLSPYQLLEQGIYFYKIHWEVKPLKVSSTP
jgi:hypothetical protein